MLEQLIQMIVNLMALLSEKYPVILAVFALMGVLRLIFKPLFVFLREFVNATPSQSDNKLLDLAEASKAYKLIAFVLDLFASVKLPEKK